MMRRFASLICLVLMALIAINAPAAAKHVALVIGNSAYASEARLKNPKNDAEKLADVLRGIGFDKVTLAHDLTQSGLNRALARFSRDAAGADIALIYFAGHGIEVAGTNYLIPVDASLDHVDDVAFQAVPLGVLMTALNRAGKLKLVILDACRVNPFAKSMERPATGRDPVGRGFVREEPKGSDTLVAYAAKAGTIAADGDGAHSPYAAALIKHLATPRLDVRRLFGKVRDEVLASTGRRQEPFTYGSLGGDAIYLNEAPARKPEESAESIWPHVKASNDLAVLEAYAERFKGTFYADTLARREIDKLKQAALRPDTRPDPDAGLSSHDLLVKGLRAENAKHYKEALDWYKRSAAKGNSNAMIAIAVLYQGAFGKRDHRKTAEWYKRAADTGNNDAIYLYAGVLALGLGIEKNTKEAIRLYKLASEFGHIKSTHALAEHYAEGNGVAKDPHKAAQLAARALKSADDNFLYIQASDYEFWSEEFIATLQKILKSAGAYAGQVDGKFSSDLQYAFKVYAGKAVPGGSARPKIERRIETQRPSNGAVSVASLIAQGKLLEALWRDRNRDLPFTSKDEALVLASIVEAEVGETQDHARIAEVFINRLKRGMRLQSDSTIVFGITRGKHPLDRPITRADISKKTPYNTYLIDGLPPGPIGPASEAAIRAAFTPAGTGDLFFVSDGRGGHKFAATSQEHIKNVKAWREIEMARRKQGDAGANTLHECDRLAGHPENDDNPSETEESKAKEFGQKFTWKIHKENAAPAVAACRKAVEQWPNLRRLQYQLGRALRAAKEYREAKEWYERAAKNGSAFGWAGLAVLYKEGQGVKRDPEKAAMLMAQAIKAGSNSIVRDMSIRFNGFGPRDFRVELQRQLKREGFYKGETNGLQNHEWIKAVKEYAGKS